MSYYEKFEGVIGRTHEDSTPWWPEPKQTVKDSPNLVVILFDDEKKDREARHKAGMAIQ